MRSQELLERGKKHLAGVTPPIILTFFPFTFGAHWMAEKLSEMRLHPLLFDPLMPYERYGWLKYISSFFIFLLSLFFFYWMQPWLIPFSIFAFYLAEVHFLFLFPLLLDKVPHPVQKSIHLTYKIGLLQTIYTVVPIGAYMAIGLLNIKHPLRNWYIGCMAILFWYHDEMGHRI